MDSLSPEARALIQASRKALRPIAADRDRIEAALRGRLGADALPVGSSVAPAPGIAVVAGAAIGVCVLGAAVLVALRLATTAPEQRPQPAPQEQKQEQEQEQEQATRSPSDPRQPSAADGEPAAPAIAPSSDSRVSAPPARDSLGREVALLSQATRALRAGQPAAALKVLRRHERRFPKGVLLEERRAAKAEALCALGHVQQGVGELEQLAPESPYGAHARLACYGTSVSRPGRYGRRP